MKAVIIAILAAGAAFTQSGCQMLLTRAQLQGKLPKFNATEVHVSASTIYGVSGSLDATNYIWKDGKKTAQTYHEKLTSPFGSYEVNARDAELDLTGAATK